MADISDIIAGRHEDEALLVLQIISAAIVKNNKEGVLEEVCFMHVVANSCYFTLPNIAGKRQ